MTISRRSFIKGVAGTAAATTALLTTNVVIANSNITTTSKVQALVKPKGHAKNILIITADQLARAAVGGYGNPHARTPAIDSIIAQGTKFSRAYTAYPLCGPSRASFWTGRLPHQNGVHGNNSPDIPSDMPTLGSLFTDVGYEAVHFGKRHDFGSLRGFDCADQIEIDIDAPDAFPIDYDTKEDVYAEQQALAFLNQPHDKPFIMAVDFNNPHNICGWVGSFAGPHGDIPGIGALPPLPFNYQNYDDISNRPKSVQYMCCRHHRMHQAAHWNDLNYQQYLAAYYHYAKLGDDCIRNVLTALANSDAANDTLVVFFSDHGDGMASHKSVTKFSFFYEETTNVPFVMAGPGIPKGQHSDELVSLCDLVPTLCDYAGIAIPVGLHGRSVMPLMQDNKPQDWREYVVSQWFTSRETITEPARMYRTKTHKYTVYQENGDEELFDLSKDPGEQLNLASDPKHSALLAEYRAKFAEYTRQTVDPFKALAIKVDPKWASHTPGYHNHDGDCAIDSYLREKKAKLVAQA